METITETALLDADIDALLLAHAQSIKSKSDHASSMMSASYPGPSGGTCLCGPERITLNTANDPFIGRSIWQQKFTNTYAHTV